MRKILITPLLLIGMRVFAGNTPPPPQGVPPPPGLPINQYNLLLFLIGVILIFIIQKKKGFYKNN